MSLLAHNKVTYEKVIKCLDVNKCCAIVQATGTGKSFITMELMHTYFKTATFLYVVPTNALATSLCDYTDMPVCRIVFLTYTALTLYIKKKIPLPKADVLILDELHHANAIKWGEAVKIAMTNYKYTLGLTATPLCGLKHSIDITQVLFRDCTVYGPDVYEAVTKGILPRFEYVALYGDIEKHINDTLGKIHNKDIETVYRNRLNKITFGDYNTLRVCSVIARYTATITHWIVFCSNLKELKEIDAQLLEWFGENVKILSVTGRDSTSSVSHTLREFSVYTGLVVLKSVNCLSEGMHVGNAQGILMLRKTSSDIVFKQQLGRVLSANKINYTPVIIDIIGNNLNFQEVTSACRKCLKLETRDTHTLINQILLIDDVLLEVSEVLCKSKCKLWSRREEHIFNMHYPIEGTSVYKRLNEKTRKDCLEHAKALGMYHDRNWETWEDDVIRLGYRTFGEELVQYLPNRTVKAISVRARTLHVTWKDWTEEDNRLLLESYDKYGFEGYSMVEGKTVPECMAQRILLSGGKTTNE